MITYNSLLPLLLENFDQDSESLMCRNRFGKTGKIRGSNFLPRADLSEKDDKYLLSIELPGMKKKNIDIYFENNRLVVKGARKLFKKESKDNYLHVERLEGSFCREFYLPEADSRNVSANYEDGVLYITTPKVKEGIRHKIVIEDRK